jgi:hypothetical protein
VPNISAGFEFEDWDGGRLKVNRQFAVFLKANGLKSCQALLNLAQGDVVRQIGTRQTTRVTLDGYRGRQTFYLKRHGAPTWREFLRPLINLSWPILGARNEWNAILRFHAAGIPTLIPVAFGEFQGESLVMTLDLETEFTLLDWVNESADRQAAEGTSTTAERRAVIAHVASIARRMHDPLALDHQRPGPARLFGAEAVVCRAAAVSTPVSGASLSRDRPLVRPPDHAQVAADRRTHGQASTVS